MKHGIPGDKAKNYHAVPPPAVLMPPQSASSKGPSIISGDLDTEKKGGRRRSRKPRQSQESPESNGASPSRIVDQDIASTSCSPSPSCMPNPSFRSKNGGFSANSAISGVRGSSRSEHCSSDMETSVGTSSGLNREASETTCGGSGSQVGNNLTRSASGVRVGYVPVAGSKTRSKECSPVPISQAKWKEASKNSKPSNDGSPSGKSSPTKSNGKFRNAQKALNSSSYVDSLEAKTSGEACSCAANASQSFLCDAIRVNNLNGEHLISAEEMYDAAQCLPGSKFRSSPSGSPTDRSSRDKGRPVQRQKNGRNSAQRSCYPPYWSSDRVSQALESGEIFRGRLRINLHNRSEAYLSLEGVPTDILIDGLQAQNRAMDGDMVAVTLDPVSTWPKTKGSISNQNSREICMAVTDEPASNELQDSSGDEGFFDTNFTVASTSKNFSKFSCGNKMLKNEKNSEEILWHLDSYSDKIVGVDTVIDLQMDEMNPLGVINAGDASCCHEEGFEANTLDLKEAGEEDGLFQRERFIPIYSNYHARTLADLATLVTSLPNKRPTGNIVAILEKSPRRKAVIGFLEVHQRLANKCGAKGPPTSREQSPSKLLKGLASLNSRGTIMLVPSDSRFPKMAVFVNTLPDNLKTRYLEGDVTLGSELVAARVDDWRAESFFPHAIVSHSLGQGGEIEARIGAILFEHAIHSAEFPPAALTCLPKLPWKIPLQEFQQRRDLRDCRIFSIDPPTARDLDDALSIECLDNDMVRVGVHIADVSFFVQPDTSLDKEARDRSTSVYLIQHVLPMLPRLLCEELCSLNPGVDRLTFSVMWDMNTSGEIVDHWFGRTIIRSCCKLTYGHAQEMIDGTFKAMEGVETDKCGRETVAPELHGRFSWKEVVHDVKMLHEIARTRREGRFEAGALRLENSKLVFALDEDGMPCDSMLYEHKDSNFLVEEFMLLANMTVAKVISRAFPDCALLRRHPEPNMRKMKEFEEFCLKIGFELDVSSSGALHESLRKLIEDRKDDPALRSILMLYATKPMQLAKYFCTGELKDKEDNWVHYALATPFYTHFTSPIRRYPDIVVHRTLAAALEADKKISGSFVRSKKGSQAAGGASVTSGNQFQKRYFTGPIFDKEASDSSAGQKALAVAATKHKVPGTAELAMLAEHCNERKLASRNVKEASDKLYLWAMLKKKQGILSDARVLAVGPKFVSLYISKIAMERRIYYDEIEGLKPEWFEATSTLVLDIVPQKVKKQRHGKHRTITDVAWLVNPADSSDINLGSDILEDVIREVQERLLGKFQIANDTSFDIQEDLGSGKAVEPAVLPLTLRLLYPIPVYVYAVGGESKPLDIAVRLYLSSYLT